MALRWSNLARIGAIIALLLALLLATAAWCAVLVAIPWMLLVQWLPQLQPEAIANPDRVLLIAVVLFIPLIIAARLVWLALERTVESYWMDQWQRWQQWKQQRLGATGAGGAAGSARQSTAASSMEAAGR